MPTKVPPSQRGLGAEHRRNRDRLLRNLVDGAPCWWCGNPLHRKPAANFDGAPLEADHTHARAHGGTKADRLLHRQCNRERGTGDRDHHRPTQARVRAMPWPT